MSVFFKYFKINMFSNIPFLRARIQYLALGYFLAGSSAAIVTKLQGIYMTATIIAAFAAVFQIGGVLQPLLRGVSEKTLIRLLISADIICGSASIAGLWNPMWFLCPSLCMGIVDNIIWMAYMIRLLEFMRLAHGDYLQEFQITTSTTNSISGISGALFGILFSSLPLEIFLVFFSFGNIASVLLFIRMNRLR